MSYPKAKNLHCDGFTLIEVLLSGFILFLVLTSMTQVYRGALLASEKAEAALRIAGAVPSIHAKISGSIRENSGSQPRAGNGQFGMLRYTWRATMTHQGEPSVFLQEDAGEEIHFFLWFVDLEVSDKSQTRVYSFTEVSW